MTPRFSLMVLAGLENACWDACGKATGKPASSFLGERVRDEVDIMAFPQGHVPDDLAMQAAAMVADGYRAIYLKVGVGNQLMHHLLAESLVQDSAGYPRRASIIPTNPGLGFELDHDVVADARWRYQRDGAYPAAGS